MISALLLFLGREPAELTIGSLRLSPGRGKAPRASFAADSQGLKNTEGLSIPLPLEISNLEGAAVFHRQGARRESRGAPQSGVDTADSRINSRSGSLTRCTATPSAEGSGVSRATGGEESDLDYGYVPVGKVNKGQQDPSGAKRVLHTGWSTAAGVRFTTGSRCLQKGGRQE